MDRWLMEARTSDGIVFLLKLKLKLAPWINDNLDGYTGAICNVKMEKIFGP